MVIQRSVENITLDAIKAYNDIVTNPLKLDTYSEMHNTELKGILYNCFRKAFPKIFNPSRKARLAVVIYSHDITCRFSDKQTLVTMSINRKYSENCIHDHRMSDYLTLNAINQTIKNIDPDSYIKEQIKRIGHPPETSKFEISIGEFSEN